MKVSIVIPWYNTEELVEKNLPKVLWAVQNRSNNIIEVILVDDASTDKSAQLIKKKFPEIKLVQHRKNRGFPSTVNTGVRTAKGELICLLNSDVLPSRNLLEKTFAHFENPRVFAVSFNEGGDLGWAKAYFKNGYVEHEPGGKPKEAHRTFWVSGGSGIFRRKTWVELGGMDEKLLSPFYWEDMDICYRAAKRGYELIWEPGATVTHVHETTISKLPQKKVARIRERNQLLFIWKNITSGRLINKHVVGLIKRVVKHPGYILIVFSALLKFGLVMKRRIKEIRESKLSDEAVFSRFS